MWGCPRTCCRLVPLARDSCRSSGSVESSTLQTSTQVLSLRRAAGPPANLTDHHLDPVLVADHCGPHAEVADRMLEVIDQLGGVEGWSRDRRL